MPPIVPGQRVYWRTLRGRLVSGVCVGRARPRRDRQPWYIVRSDQGQELLRMEESLIVHVQASLL